MSNNSKNTKSTFISFVMNTIEHETSDIDKAREYLETQGVNVDSMLSAGMQRIKLMKLKVAAEETELQMAAAQEFSQKACAWVNDLLQQVDFSLPELVKQEGLTLSFRNIDKLDLEDIRRILIKHFTIKFNQDQFNQPG